MNIIVDTMHRIASSSTNGRVEPFEGKNGCWICHMWIDSHCVAVECDGHQYGVDELDNDPDTILLNGYNNVFDDAAEVVEWLGNWAKIHKLC